MIDFKMIPEYYYFSDCLLFFLIKGLEQTCGLFAIAGMDVTVPLEYKLQSGDRLKWKRGNTVIFDRKGSNVKTGKAEDVSENGSLILKKVSKTDENLYAPEIYDSSGKNQGSFKEIRLCLLGKMVSSQSYQETFFQSLRPSMSPSFPASSPKLQKL